MEMHDPKFPKWDAQQWKKRFAELKETDPEHWVNCKRVMDQLEEMANETLEKKKDIPKRDGISME